MVAGGLLWCMSVLILIVMWGGNPASTQVNFMKHVQNARKKNNAFLIVIDPYLTKTAKIADLHIKLRPGTDGALACGIMKHLIENRKILSPMV